MTYNNEILNKYYKDLSKHKPIESREEEIELIRLIQLGDEKAKEKLILSNLRFVITVAQDYVNTDVSLSDLISEGNYGLIIAAEKFDAKRTDIKFISYAVWWIKQTILQYLNESSRIIRIPVNKITEIINSDDIDINDTYKKLNLPQVTSLDVQISDDGSTFMDIIGINNNHNNIDEEMTEQANKTKIKEMFEGIDGREQYILSAYYGVGQAPMTLQQIADELDLTKERVRQIKSKTLLRLRDKLYLFFD